MYIVDPLCFMFFLSLLKLLETFKICSGPLLSSFTHTKGNWRTWSALNGSHIDSQGDLWIDSQSDLWYSRQTHVGVTHFTRGMTHKEDQLIPNLCFKFVLVHTAMGEREDERKWKESRELVVREERDKKTKEWKWW
ncbi:hypothetical protein Pfo_006991 [Paulownia fortunei]|nr:hypothetical protein Pfo_006991 [Paulownia fortunei]